MRFAVPRVALLAVISSTSAALFARQDIPTCAASCLANANTTCSLTNYSCLCNDKAFLNATYNCAKSTCSSSDFQTAETTAEDLCKAVGVVLTTASATAASATSTQHSSGVSLTWSNNMLVGIAAALAIVAV